MVVMLPNKPSVDAAITAVKLSDTVEKPTIPRNVKQKSNMNSRAKLCSNHSLTPRGK